MSGSAKVERTSATVLPFKLPPDAERFPTRTVLIGMLFLKFGWAVDSGEIDLDDDPAVVKKVRLYSWAVQAICEMPNEDIDELQKFLGELEFTDQPEQVLQYAKDYIVDEWSP